jgi:glycerol dehydrogenase
MARAESATSPTASVEVTRIFAATARYIQGPNTLDMLGSCAAELGKSLVVITDAAVARLFGARIEASCKAAKLAVSVLQFPGEVTQATIDDLAAKAMRKNADMIAGIGGGKAVDTAKGVARKLGCRVISVPTIASNDGRVPRSQSTTATTR